MAQVQPDISTFSNIARYGICRIIFLEIRISFAKDKKTTPWPSNKKDANMHQIGQIQGHNHSFNAQNQYKSNQNYNISLGIS